MRSFFFTSALALILFSTGTPADAATVRMFVRHEVTDYETWRKAYDGFKATQRQMGVVAQSVYQSIENPNDIIVLHDFKTKKSAQTFAGSDKLKTAMQQSGVKGTPTIWYTKMAPGSSGKPGGHVRMFVRNEVTDYATWRKSYDAFQPTVSKMGATAQAVYQGIDNPNDVTVIHDFASQEKARALAASPELKAAMQSAGVRGQPQFWITTRAGK